MKKREDDPVLAAWCESVLTYIRGKDVRREIYDELYGHMEDKLEALMSAGIGKKEAQALTVKAMGDYNETGRELAKIYKPAWWRVLVAARTVFIIVAVVAALMVLDFALAGAFDRPARGDNDPWDTVQSVVYPDREARLYGYTLSIPRVTRESNGTVYFTLSVKKPLPWSKSADLYHGFYIADSDGNVYKAADSENRERVLYISYGSSGLLTDYFEGHITGMGDAEWFELRCDSEGRELSLRVELGGDKNGGA